MCVCVCVFVYVKLSYIIIYYYLTSEIVINDIIAKIRLQENLE